MTDSNDSTLVPVPFFSEELTPDGRLICKATASRGNSLASLLDWIVSKDDNNKYRYGYRDTWEITIIDDDYPQVISKRIVSIRCNIIIKGSDSKSKIYFDSGVVAPIGDDAIICFTGEDFDHRISVQLINLEFMRVGLTDKGELQEGSNFYEGSYLLKIWYAKEIVIYNCDSTLCNGKISNLDIRVADDITVDNCHFINENGLMLVSDEPGKFKPNDYGCIILIRGKVNNVRISHNTFEKYGNDEVIAFFGDSNVYDKVTYKTPEWKQRYIQRRNIEVTGNTIIYGYPKYGPISYLYAHCDVLITFNGAEEYLQNYLQNVDFSFNTIDCNLPVYRVIGFGNLECAKKNLNVKVHDNIIKHSYNYENLGTTDTEMAVDFSFSYSEGNKGLASSEPIEIFNNTVIAEEKMWRSVHGHINIDLQGGSVVVRNNNFDSSEFVLNQLNDGQPQGSIVMQVKDNESRMVFSGNTCTGVGLLGRIEMSNCDGDKCDTSRFKTDIELTDNYVDGVSKFFFQPESQDQDLAPTEVNLRLERNFFKTTSYELLAQQFSPKGSLWASLNVWDTQIKASPSQTTEPSYCTVFAYYPLPNLPIINLERVTFISNVIYGEKIIGTIDLPSAEATVIANNQLNKSSDAKE